MFLAKAPHYSLTRKISAADVRANRHKLPRNIPQTLQWSAGKVHRRATNGFILRRTLIWDVILEKIKRMKIRHEVQMSFADAVVIEIKIAVLKGVGVDRNLIIEHQLKGSGSLPLSCLHVAMDGDFGIGKILK